MSAKLVSTWNVHVTIYGVQKLISRHQFLLNQSPISTAIQQSRSCNPSESFERQEDVSPLQINIISAQLGIQRNNLDPNPGHFITPLPLLSLGTALLDRFLHEAFQVKLR